MYHINNINYRRKEYLPSSVSQNARKISFGASTSGDEFVVAKKQPEVGTGVLSKIKSVFSKKEKPDVSRNNSVQCSQKTSEIRINPLYTDTKAFSVYLSEKINKMLDNRSENDIQGLIEEVSKETGEKEEVVTEVISALTQFSGWNSLDSIEKSFQNAQIKEISPIFTDKKHTMSGYAEIGPPMTCDLTLNDVLKYAFERKGQINFQKTGVKALFLDDATLNLIEKTKDKNRDIFYELTDELDSGKTKLFMFDGWNAKAGGKNVGQSLFGASCDIKEATSAIIKKMQDEHSTIDEAMNADTINRAKEIFEKDVEVEIIKNEDIQTPCAKSISKNVSSPYPSAKQIETAINILTENCLPKKYPQDKAKALLCEYFDTMLTCHSSRTMTKELQKKHAEIVEAAEKFGAKEEDLVYVIPNNQKSYNLTSYQYAKANDIDASKFVYYSGKGDFPRNFDKKEVNLDGKTLVILDDMVGSGYSMALNGFYYTEFMSGLGRDCNVIMAPLVSQRCGVDFIEKTTDMVCTVVKHDERPKDVLLPGTIVDFNDFLETAGLPKGKLGFLNRDLSMFMKTIGGFGYDKTACCSAFPYMLPDNNSPAAGLLLSPFLKSNNCEANRSNEYYVKFRQAFENGI